MLPLKLHPHISNPFIAQTLILSSIETRGQLYEKELALQSELAKENPDTNKASSLQQEISKLQGELDQKRLDFEIQTRKSSPNYDRAYRGHGRMMGSGYGGRGYCWR